MSSFDVNGLAERIGGQLGALEKTLGTACVHINSIEQYLNGKINRVKERVNLMSSSKDVNMLVGIVDMIEEIKRIVDKLDSVDITPIGDMETSLDELISQEYDELNSIAF